MRVLLALLIAASVMAGERPTITIYQDGYAVIKETREATLGVGLNDVTIGDLPKVVMGESFALNGRDVVLRQFEFKPPTQPYYSLDQMWSQARGKEVSFKIDSATTVRGKLLQADSDNFVYLQMTDGSVRVYPRASLKDWVFYDPTLNADRPNGEFACKLECANAGPHAYDVKYETAGFQWNARYRLVMKDDSAGTLEGWASILNRSGKSFEDANVVLVEGRLGRYRNYPMEKSSMKISGARSKMDLSSATLQNFGGGEAVEVTAQRRAVAEMVVPYAAESYLGLTLYSLRQSATLKDDSQIDLAYLAPSPVKVYQQYSTFNASEIDRTSPVASELIMLTGSKEGVPLALPEAQMQLYRETNEEVEQFVGSVRLNKTATGDTVRLKLGNDPQIVCRTKMLNKDGSGMKKEVSFSYSIKNSKSEPVKVLCREKFYGLIEVIRGDLETKVFDEYPNPNFKIVEFTMSVPPNQETTAEFTVKVRPLK